MTYSEEYSRLIAKIHEVMGGDPRAQFDGLVQIIQDARKMPFGSERTAIINQTQAILDKKKAESKAFSEESAKICASFQSKVDNAIAEICSIETSEIRNAMISLGCLAKEIREAPLIKTHRESLRASVNIGFEILRSKQKQIDDQRREKEEFRARIKSEITLYSGARFSELILPTIERAPAREGVVSFGLAASCDLRGLLRIYPSVFNFSGSYKKGEFRPQQVQFMEMCYEGVQTGRDVVVEGPTGLGKTKALLAAALPFILEKPGRKIVYATRTVTQVNSIMADLREILDRTDKKLEGILASVHIGANRVRDELIKCYIPVEDLEAINEIRKAKGWSIFTSSYCNKGCQRFGYLHKTDFEGSLIQNPVDLENNHVIDLRMLTENQQYCPAGIFRRATEKAQIIVVPHAFIYDSAWRDEYLGDLNDAVLILDEAHNFLADAAKNPYITLARTSLRENLEDEQDEDDEVDRRAVEDRKTNHFVLEDMLARVEKNAPKADFRMEVAGINVEVLFSYLDNLFSEMSSHISKFRSDKNLLQANESGSKFYLVADGDIFELTKSLGSGFLDNLVKLDDLVSKAKAEIKAAPQYRRMEQSLYSYQQITESLINIFNNPYEFMILDYGDGFEFHNLHPKMNIMRASIGFHSRIFTSATLSPPEDVAYVLGLPDALNAKLDPVFPDENYLPFFIAGVNSSRKEESGNPETFTQKEKAVIKDVFRTAFGAATGKNIGVFCSSNEIVLDTYRLLKDVAKDQELVMTPFVRSDVIDPREIKELEKEFRIAYELLEKKYLAKFRKDPKHADLTDITDKFNDVNAIKLFKLLGYSDKTAILIGVAGGTLSEGIDYFGEQMEMVITVGLPYPSSATEIMMNKRKEDYFFMQKGDRRLGEDLAYKQDAFRKLAQSIGRAHRRITDRAVVICLDERLLAIKNTGGGYGSYEYLSMGNARKNLRILQRPLWKFDSNIVFPGKNAAEENMLKRYIASGLCSPRDFISIDEMGRQIRKFFQK